jgi:sodium pump decarboxylase gamma subunit
MEHILELIENGQAGYVTAMGMGGVFTALLFLFLFISSLGKVYRFKKLRSRKKNAPRPRPTQPPRKVQPSGEEIVAAVAVACAMAGRGRRTGVSIPPGGEEEPSPWKTAGRLALMRPFVRPKKD